VEYYCASSNGEHGISTRTIDPLNQEPTMTFDPADLARIYSIAEAADFLRLSRERIRQLLKQLQIEPLRGPNGEQQLTPAHIEQLLGRRTQTGRPREKAATGELPRSAPETARNVLAALERILSPQSLDFFTRSRKGRIALTSQRWKLAPTVQEYLSAAVRALGIDESGRTISRAEAETIYARLLAPSDIPEKPIILPLRETAFMRCMIEVLTDRVIKPLEDRYGVSGWDRQLPLASPLFQLDAPEQAFITAALHKTEISRSDAEKLRTRITQLLNPQHILESDPLFSFLTYGKGLLLNQTTLIYGRYGTGKSRLACMLAVRIALETKREVWYYPLESSSHYQLTLIEHTLNEYSSAYPLDGKRVKVVAGSDDGNYSDKQIIPIKIFGTPLTWDEVRADLLEALEEARGDMLPAAIIIDSIGPFSRMDRTELDQLLNIAHMQEKEMMVILVGEEDEGGQFVSEALAHALWTSDLLMHTRIGMPNGREAVDLGLARRVIEVSKSRRHAFIEGRHWVRLAEERIDIAPALSSWFRTSAVRVEAITRSLEERAYTPGLTLTDPKEDPLGLLAPAYRNYWNRGGSLALFAPEKCEKDLIALYALRNALNQGFSGILLNMRVDYAQTLRTWAEERVPPQFTCFANGFAQRIVPIDFERVMSSVENCISDTPTIYVLPVDPENTPEEFIWTLYSMITRSHHTAAPIACLSWNHYSEMLGLPQTRHERDFTLATLRMLAATGVSSVINIDPESYERHVTEYQLPNVLPLMDVRWNLTPRNGIVQIAVRDREHLALKRLPGDGCRFLGVVEDPKDDVTGDNMKERFFGTLTSA
jgi:hypothetical protein